MSVFVTYKKKKKKDRSYVKHVDKATGSEKTRTDNREEKNKKIF